LVYGSILSAAGAGETFSQSKALDLFDNDFCCLQRL